MGTRNKTSILRSFLFSFLRSFSSGISRHLQKSLEAKKVTKRNGIVFVTLFSANRTGATAARADIGNND